MVGRAARALLVVFVLFPSVVHAHLFDSLKRGRPAVRETKIFSATRRTLCQLQSVWSGCQKRAFWEAASRAVLSP